MSAPSLDRPWNWKKSRINRINTLQETRWSGAKGYDVERERSKNFYELLYFNNPHTQYDVGIAISEDFRDAIKEVERFEGLKKLTVISVDHTIHFFTAYAPQAVRSDGEEDALWCADDQIVIADGPNVHVGERADGHRCYGEKALKGGKRIVCLYL